ncbi:MAG: glutamyl-tRNA reductase [Lacipirellulaceae bacterium]
MNLRMVGCTHRAASLDVRQQLAFGESQAEDALNRWREEFPETELALLSTCNRVELYAATDQTENHLNDDRLADALLGYHRVPRERVDTQLTRLSESEVVSHIYRVASSLDSMVVGEPQILSQVKDAYQRAHQTGTAGPLLHELFQSALRTARRVAGETDLHRHRVSIPSVAIGDFASRVFERFDDKHVLVLGAGEMAEETLRYLRDEGARKIYVANRDAQRGAALAERFSGVAVDWDDRWLQLGQTDLVVSTTAAQQPIVTADAFDKLIAPSQRQRSLFILDLAVPRDFEAAVGERLGVYLYSLDDLELACAQNRKARADQLPLAEEIVADEAHKFLAEARHRAAAPVITDFRRGLEQPKQAELERLFAKLPDLDEKTREEITQFADRLVNKMLYPPLKSLRDASEEGSPNSLIDALKRLFWLDD